MGLRFRKSFKIAPGVRLNFGKKSAGVSIGGKFGGVSYNSRNGVHARVSAPGTGLSYTTPNTKSSKRSSASGQGAKSGGMLGGIAAAFIVIGLIASCGDQPDSTQAAPTEPAATVTPAPTAATPALPSGIYAAGVNDIYYHSSDCEVCEHIPYEDLEQFATCEAAERAGYKPDKDCLPERAENYVAPTTEPVRELPTQVPTGGVYIASTESDKYHLPSCRFANSIKDSNQVTFSTIEDAKAHGYSPCGVCNPG